MTPEELALIEESLRLAERRRAYALAVGLYASSDPSIVGPPPPPIPWATRLRWRWLAAREWVAAKVLRVRLYEERDDY